MGANFGLLVQKFASNSGFCGFGAMPAAQNKQFWSFFGVQFSVLFRKNVCLGTVGVPTVAQKRRGQNNENYFLDFQVFGIAKKHYFLVSPEVINIATCSIFLRPAGRRVRDRLLLAWATRKSATERTNQAQNPINCGFRAMFTRKQI